LSDDVFLFTRAILTQPNTPTDTNIRFQFHLIHSVVLLKT
jgi:hypothetical protein